MNQALRPGSILLFLCASAFSQEYTKEDVQNRHTTAYPVSRLQRDWIYQDHGLKNGDCFVSPERNDMEQAMVGKVLGELKARNAPTDALEKTLSILAEEKKPGNDPAWKDLYFRRVPSVARNA